MEVVARFLAVLAPILSFRRQQDLADLVTAMSKFLHTGKDADERFEAVTADVEAMVKAGVNPTDVQLAAVRERRLEVSEAIQAVDLSEPDPEADLTAELDELVGGEGA